MAQRHVTILALALAAGIAPIAVQAQTTLTPSQATPRDNSSSGSTARELKPLENLPTSQATPGATPRDNSRVGSEPRELRVPRHERRGDQLGRERHADRVGQRARPSAAYQPL